MGTEVEVGIAFAQGRRLDCDGCGQSFTYLHYGIDRQSNRNLVGTESKSELVCWAVKFALRSIRHEVLAKRRGVGICPHCKCYQRWMVLRSYVERVVLACLVGPALFGGVPFVYGVMNARNWQDWIGLYITGAIVGLVGGIVLGRFIGLRRGPHDEVPDTIPTMTDEELATFLNGYGDADEEAEPAVDWLRSSNVDMPSPFLTRLFGGTVSAADFLHIVDGGFRDDGVPPLIPEFYHSRPAIDRAEARFHV